jgi:adenylate kinase family enzyme
VSVPVERIAIVGCGGSGKSHLASVLAARLGITPVHLDALYYDAEWKPLGQETFAAVQRELVAAPRWIIDGNYASTLPIRLEAADMVIFLDLPSRACLWGIFQRRLRHGGGQHPTIGVYDRITWGFIRYVVGYRRKMAPRIRALMADHARNAQVTVLPSRAAVRHYVAAVSVVPPAGSLPRRARCPGGLSGR